MDEAQSMSLAIEHLIQENVLLTYGLLTLESGLSELGEAHHPFDRILARENLRQERGEVFFGVVHLLGLRHARVRERPLDAERRLLCDQVPKCTRPLNSLPLGYDFLHQANP